MVRASMAGTVWKVMVQPGDRVTARQEIVILESMKMEVPIQAEKDGVVAAVRVKPGDFVNQGDLLVEVN